MILELVGLPGSGKTFLAPILAKKHDMPVVSTNWFGERYLLALLFFLTHFELSCQMLRRVRIDTAPYPYLKRRKLRRFISIVAREQKARLLGKGLIDEGLFQYLITIYENEAPAGEIEYFLGLLDRGIYRVYLLEVDDMTRARRMAQRGKTPRAHMGPEYQQHWQQISRKNFVRLKSLLLKQFNATVYNND